MTPLVSNFHEGKGTTGWALFVDGELEEFGAISSKDSETQEHYWYEHSLLINQLHPDLIVMESYKIFASKSKQQINSSMETPQLIGYIRMHAWLNTIPVYFQDPKDKARVADPILVREGAFEKRGQLFYCKGKRVVIHTRDAIRHGIFYHRYRKKD